jgi:cell division topological specificity factor
MSIFNLFLRQSSAPVARDRLQILLAHERAARGQSDLLGILREEILTVIAKHVMLDHDHLIVRMDRGATVSTLEIEIEIPTPAGPAMPVDKRDTSAARVGSRSVQSSARRVQSVAYAAPKHGRHGPRLSGRDGSPG